MIMDEVQIDSVERLATLSAEEVDKLPYGFLVLDREGTILLYNRYESRMSRLPPERVLGRNWFQHVAPCTRVEAFQGRFRALLDRGDDAVDRFAFRFHFLHGAQDVVVQMSRVPGDDGRVFMTVVRRRVPGADATGSTVTLVEDRGAIVGPLGPTMPVAAAAFGELLDRVGVVEARELGATTGRTLATTAEDAAREASAPALGEAPLLLRSGVLDATVARAGLGRLALDLTAWDTASAVGVLVRPPSSALTAGLAAFYEGLLATMLESAQGARLSARRLDVSSDLSAIPWLFALVPDANARDLAARPGERDADVARRLGLAGVDDD